MSALPIPRKCSDGSTATGPMAVTVATTVPSPSSTGQGVIRRCPTIRPPASTATSDCQPSGASSRIRSTMSASSGPVNAASSIARIAGASPGASRRTETGNGGGPSDANTPAGPPIIAPGSAGDRDAGQRLRDRALHRHGLDVSVHHPPRGVGPQLGEQEPELAALGGEDLVLRVQLPQPALERADRLLPGRVQELLLVLPRLALVGRVLAAPGVDLVGQ